MSHSLTRVNTLGLGPVPECREFALERLTWLGLGGGGVEDWVTGPEVAPVSIEQLVDTDGVVGAEGRSVDSMGNLAGKVLLGTVVGALLHLPGLVQLQTGVEARVRGLESGLDDLERTGHYGPGSSSDPEKYFSFKIELYVYCITHM